MLSHYDPALERACEVFQNSIDGEPPWHEVVKHWPEEAARVRTFMSDVLAAAREATWCPIVQADHEGIPLRLFDPTLVHGDFNPTGGADGCWQDDEGWKAGVWCDVHDHYVTKIINPTHFQPMPAKPGGGA